MQQLSNILEGKIPAHLDVVVQIGHHVRCGHANKDDVARALMEGVVRDAGALAHILDLLLILMGKKSTTSLVDSPGLVCREHDDTDGSEYNIAQYKDRLMQENVTGA